MGRVSAGQTVQRLPDVDVDWELGDGAVIKARLGRRPLSNCRLWEGGAKPTKAFYVIQSSRKLSVRLRICN